MAFCSYYQAHVEQAKCWYVVAILRSFEHIAFDRTLDVQTSLFEFFVPEATESHFLELMAYFQEQGIVTNLRKVPNRIIVDDTKP